MCFVNGNMNLQAADQCDDFVDRLHHHITTGLLTLFAIASSMCVLRFPIELIGSIDDFVHVLCWCA